MAGNGLLKVSDAAQRLGVSAMTLKRWIAANKIKAKKISGRFYIRSDELEAFINKN